MPKKKSTKAKEVIHFHKDGSIWAKGQSIDGVQTGYWEWFRKCGVIMRSGNFDNGVQVGDWTTYGFKEDLQALSNRLGLKIRICHYPPYCSKYNPIEHRVFPHVTRACQGVPLETIETAKHYLEKTETTKGLNVVVRMLDKVYQTGRKYAKDFKQNMTIKFDEYLPKWNYTAIPDGR